MALAEEIPRRQNLEFDLLGLRLALVQCFLTLLSLLSFRMVTYIQCYCSIEFCGLLFDLEFTGDYTEAQKRLWTLNFQAVLRPRKDYGDFCSQSECIFPI